MRSAIGRIDTDMLNLFFPFLVSLLILMASRAKTERSVLLYSAGAGIGLFLFMWWYHKTGFTLVYFAALVFYLFVQKIRFQTILLSTLLFILCSHPGNFIGSTSNFQNFLKGYFSIEEAHELEVDSRLSPATFPNTMATISEVDHVPMVEALKRVLSQPMLAGFGLISFLF